MLHSPKMDALSRGPTSPIPQGATRLLLIEKDSRQAYLIREQLMARADFSFEIREETSLEEGLRWLEQESYDVVLLDLSLVQPDQGQAITQIVERTSGAALIVLSELDTVPQAMETLSQGAVDYLVKPQIDSRLLARTIRYALRINRLRWALRESEERYALAAEATNDGLWDWDLRTDEMRFSPRWCQMLGYTQSELSTRPSEWFDRIHPDDRQAVMEAIDTHLRGGTTHFKKEYRIRHRDGNYRWMLGRGLALSSHQGTAYRMAGSQTDITERKLTEARLLYEALHDTLTGLPNRTLFMERLEHSIKEANKQGKHDFAVLFLDLDRFKNINDSLGHLIGDQLLTKIAKRLESCIAPLDAVTRLGNGEITDLFHDMHYFAPLDTISRFGGDEFAILLHNITETKHATTVAERILEALERPFRVQEHEVFSSASIGIAFSSPIYTRPEEMLRDADTAMYRAKAQGRARYEIFDAAMHARAMAIWRLETDLRRALERQEFRIHYQPIVSLATGKLAGFEALVRWQHPERGLLHPQEFLDLAEETGLIASIDRWTIRTGALQLKLWQTLRPQSPPLFLSVNLSGAILGQPDLVEYVAMVLEESELDPQTLKLEITENVVRENVINIARTLAALRSLKVQLCIDDFGTGYSSLSSLHYYPIDTLKIDASFVKEMTAEGGNTEIVRTIVTLAHDLELNVIAEGIETPQQLARLRELQCEFGQGSLFSQAIDHRSTRSLIVQDPSWA